MAIQFLRGTKSKVAASTKVLADGQPLYETDTNKLKVGDGSTQAKSLPYVKVDTDSHLSSTSTNPVQNKVVTTALNYKLQLSGGTMTGALTTKGIKLTSGTDYGDTLPSSPATNQLFFQTVGSNFVLDNVYPVGSIYMNVNSTNPGTLFGGTWEQIQGKFLLGMSSSYPAGSQGGEAEHTLTASQIPTHSHYLRQLGNTSRTLPSNYATHDPSEEYYATELTSPGSSYLKPNVTWGGYLIAGELLDTPNGQPHNNMPPYLSVYIWKRTA